MLILGIILGLVIAFVIGGVSKARRPEVEVTAEKIADGSKYDIRNHSLDMLEGVIHHLTKTYKLKRVMEEIRSQYRNLSLMQLTHRYITTPEISGDIPALYFSIQTYLKEKIESADTSYLLKVLLDHEDLVITHHRWLRTYFLKELSTRADLSQEMLLPLYRKYIQKGPGDELESQERNQKRLAEEVIGATAAVLTPDQLRAMLEDIEFSEARNDISVYICNTIAEERSELDQAWMLDTVAFFLGSQFNCDRVQEAAAPVIESTKTEVLIEALHIAANERQQLKATVGNSEKRKGLKRFLEAVLEVLKNRSLAEENRSRIIDLLSSYKLPLSTYKHIGEVLKEKIPA